MAAIPGCHVSCPRCQTVGIHRGDWYCGKDGCFELNRLKNENCKTCGTPWTWGYAPAPYKDDVMYRDLESPHREENEERFWERIEDMQEIERDEQMMRLEERQYVDEEEQLRDHQGAAPMDCDEDSSGGDGEGGWKTVQSKRARKDLRDERSQEGVFAKEKAVFDGKILCAIDSGRSKLDVREALRALLGIGPPR